MLERLKKSLPGRLFGRYSAADAGLYATVIAYNALFAIFPIVLALAFVLGRLTQGAGASAQISAAVASALPPDAAGEIDRVLLTTREASGILGLVSILGLLWAGSGLFGALSKAFDRIYGVPDRPFIREKIMSVGMIFVFSILFLLALGLTAAAQFLLEFTSTLPIDSIPGIVLLAPAVSLFLSFLSALALFLVIYYVVPNLRLRVVDAFPGAVLGAVLFWLLAQAFPLYVRLFADFNRYGAFFGFALLLLTWLYFVAQVLLIGAALNAEWKSNPQPRM